MWWVEIESVEPWLDSLDRDSLEHVVAALQLPREWGPQPGRPLVDTVANSRHRNMQELRSGSSGRTELRVLFAFAPERSAILLLGGDKSGDWSRWYRRMIPAADHLFDEHLENLRKGR